MIRAQILTFLVLCLIYVKANQFSKAESAQAFRAAVRSCMTKHNANDADFYSVMRNSDDPPRREKCLRKCLMKKYDLLKDDGTLAVQRLIVLTDAFSNGNSGKIRHAEEIANLCSMAVGRETDKCEMAYLYDSCIRNEIKDRGLSA